MGLISSFGQISRLRMGGGGEGERMGTTVLGTLKRHSYCRYYSHRLLDYYNFHFPAATVPWSSVSLREFNQVELSQKVEY